MTSTVTGSGEVSYRLVIERWPESWVTHQSMENAAVTPKRYMGLSVRGAKIKHIANPLTAEAEVSSLTCRVADVLGRATAAFAQRPTLKTWLTFDATTAAATILCRANPIADGWPTTGTLWVNSEAINYTGRTTAPNRFTGCGGANRARLDSQLQKHYVSTGGYTRYPEITNRPPTMAGCRAWLYRYEATDDPQGDGTIYWRGIVTKDPVYDGATWTLAIEPLTVLLERSVNADIANSARPRGIYYPDNAYFSLNLTSDASGGSLAVNLSGFWETNQDFVDDINTAIAASSFDANNRCRMTAVADGDSSWHLEMLASVGCANVNVRIGLLFRGGANSIEPDFNRWPVDDADDPFALPIEGGYVNGTTYFWLPQTTSTPGAGGVPRGVFGYNRRPLPGIAGGTNPQTRIYFGGGLDLTGLTGAMIEWKEFGSFSGTESFHSVLSYSSGTRYIDFSRGTDTSAAESMYGWTPALLPEIRFGRDYGTGNLGTFLEGIVDAVPNGLNLGAVPPLRSDDFEQTLPAVFPAIADRIVNGRSYTSFGSSDLMDIIKPECLLAGYGLGLTPTGKVRFYLVQPPNTGSIVTGTLTTTGFVISSPTGDVSWAPMGRGTANQVTVLRGYRSQDDDYAERPVTVRDVAAFGQSPRPLSIKIEPKSFITPVESYSEVVEVARRQFALFAYPYAHVVVPSDLRFSSRAHGDIVYVTSSRIPDVATGTMGVSNMPMLVTGFEKSPTDPQIKLHGIAIADALAGYVPEFQILSEVNVSGNTWDLTLDMGSLTSSDYFAANYGVRVWEFDGTGSVVLGGVASVTGSVVRVTFGTSAAAITSGTWVLGWYSASDGIDPGQEFHAYMADSTGYINTGSGSTATKVFS